jgi:para-aminobenzoate synthetase component 1
LTPVPKAVYTQAYQKVVDEIYQGNTFLLNLTFPSAIQTPLHLEDVFHWAKAPYKLLYQNHFVVYSPECFVKIKDGHIYSYPMKGTIDAQLPEAKKKLETDPKEINEHNTIVDLIRNDLSKVAKQVQVTRFRYLDKIKTQKNEIYHTSSEIKGKLSPDWKSQLPDILLDMLPAGSICGAPKAKTVSIIQEVEQGPRGYYTGIFGYFDGENLDSAVNIRYLEKKDGQLLYRSGGGITFLSDLESEYNELIEKIYVPVV